MPYFELSEDEIAFPHPKYAEPDGFLAVGGDLSLSRLLLGYRYGIFPWYNPGERIRWWCPRERYVIWPAEVHISHSMRKFMRKHSCRIELNRNFAATMHSCRAKREGETWITDEMEEAYGRLHKAGHAVSVEAFIDEEPAGGLYGVILGRCFFGESMYTERENGSKVALILFAELLAENDYILIDCQFHTDHLESMGGVYISREDYQRLLDEGIGEDWEDRICQQKMPSKNR